MTETHDKAEREWACEYEFRGARWNVPGLYATTREEAAAKLRAIGATGVVLGEIAFRSGSGLLIGSGWFVVGGLVGVLLGSAL